MKVVPPITISDTEGSFTRNSSATYFDKTGTMQTAAVNAPPRVTYDPTTKQCLGVLYEPSRQNLLPINTRNSIYSYTVPGYTAYRNASVLATSYTEYTISFRGTGTVYNTLTNRPIFSLQGTGATNKVSVTINSGANATRFLALFFTGYIYDFQIELGTTATSYIPDNSIRAADTFTGTPPCLVYSNVPNESSTADWVSNSAYVAGTKVYRSTTNCVYQATGQINNNTTTATIAPEVSVLLANPYWRQLDALPWVSGTTYTYTPSQALQVTYQNRTYELIATTVINTTTPNTSSPVYWLDVGPSNRWAAFDYLRNSATSVRSQLILSVLAGTRVDTLVLVGLKNVSEAVVTVYSPSQGTTTYTQYKNLATKASASWYDYFFVKGVGTKSAVFSNLLPASDAVISVVLNGTDISCGGIVMGKAQELGTLQRGATNEVINFSTVTRDLYGNATMVQRRNIPRTNQTLYLDKSLVNAVIAVRDQLNAAPAAWIGLEDLPDQYYFESLLIVGFYKTFSINIDNPIGVIINLELEEI